MRLLAQVEVTEVTVATTGDKASAWVTSRTKKAAPGSEKCGREAEISPHGFDIVSEGMLEHCGAR